MAYKPWNLALRFLLEVAALIALSYWGWKSTGWIMPLGAPIVAAALWGVFTVPGDPSRSGRAPVPIPGWLRLILELAILFGAAWALVSVELGLEGLVLGAVVTAHYAISYDRIAWLVRR